MPLKPYNKIPSGDPALAPNCQGGNCKSKIESKNAPSDPAADGAGEAPASVGTTAGKQGDKQGDKGENGQAVQSGQPNKQATSLKPYNKIPSGDPALAPNCQGDGCKTNIKPMKQPVVENGQSFPKNEPAEIKTNQ